MRYDPQQKVRTKMRVLKEAMLVIRNSGMPSLGVKDVMQRSGLTYGGFYHHFRSREELLTAAVEKLFGIARSNFERRIRDLSAGDSLTAYIGYYLSEAHRDAEELGCPLPLLSSDLLGLSDALHERFSRAIAWLTREFVDRVRETNHPEPDSAASSAVAEMIGTVSLARAMGHTPQSDVILLQAREAILGRLRLASPT